MVVRNALAVVSGLVAVAGGAIVAVAARSEVQIDLDANANGERMTSVSAGSVMRGDAGPSVGAFEIDAREVSVAEYARCVRAGACRLNTSAADPRLRPFARSAESGACRGGRPDRLEDPMNCVDQASAAAYCRWVGKRLPTRDEWWRAVGDRHPDRAPELHRTGHEESWFAAEWTATPAKVAGREQAGLFVLGHWRTANNSNLRPFEAFEDWLPSQVRSAWVLFRCAR